MIKKFGMFCVFLILSSVGHASAMFCTENKALGTESLKTEALRIIDVSELPRERFDKKTLVEVQRIRIIGGLQSVYGNFQAIATQADVVYKIATTENIFYFQLYLDDGTAITKRADGTILTKFICEPE